MRRTMQTMHVSDSISSSSASQEPDFRFFSPEAQRPAGSPKPGTGDMQARPGVPWARGL